MRKALLLAVVALLWMGITASRIDVWGVDRRLWIDAVAQAPHKPRPWVNLGRAYAAEGATDLARDAFDTAIRLTQQPGRTREERTDGRRLAQENRDRLTPMDWQTWFTDPH